MTVDKKSAQYREHRRTFLWLGSLMKWRKHCATCSTCGGYVQKVAEQ